MISKSRYEAALEYIESYWEKLTFFLPEDRGIHIALPNPFVAPTPEGGIFAYDQFYWDSYFIILGLVVSERELVGLAKGMVDNLVYLFKRFGIIPSRNRYYNLGISQPPFLTSMALEVFERTKDKNWLKEVARVAELELKNYWMNELHRVYKGLSRYCDHFITHLTAEHESGWDMTSRFNEKCLDYLPVDLNSCLYKYEIDLARIYGILNLREKQKYYVKRARARREALVNLMWNEDKGFFFDYNYRLKKQREFYSVAGFYPLWAGLASEDQAEELRKNLKILERDGGMANTQEKGLSREFKQHDYPNGWPNQQWIVIKGLLNYGFKKDAERIARKWLDLNLKVFEKTGKFWEKYDVVECSVGKSGRYPTQSGFGWTNAVFLRLISEFSK